MGKNIDLEYLTKKYTKCYRDGTIEEENGDVISEYNMMVYVNDYLKYHITCSAKHLQELIIGRLFTDEKIKNISQVISIDINKQENYAKVEISEKENQLKLEEVQVTSCDSGIRNNQIKALEINEKNNSFYWTKEWIFKIYEEFDKETPIYNKTRGVHSCFLFYHGEIKYMYEDIGRHNALDKTIGRAIMDGVDLSQCIIFVSGRIPIDMIRKAIVCNVPLIASKTVPSYEAIDYANKFGIVLIGKVRKDNFCIYSSNAILQQKEEERHL